MKENENFELVGSGISRFYPEEERVRKYHIIRSYIENADDWHEDLVPLFGEETIINYFQWEADERAHDEGLGTA